LKVFAQNSTVSGPAFTGLRKQDCPIKMQRQVVLQINAKCAGNTWTKYSEAAGKSLENNWEKANPRKVAI